MKDKNHDHETKQGERQEAGILKKGAQDTEFSEIGKPVINKKIPKNVPGIDTGNWAD